MSKRKARIEAAKQRTAEETQTLRQRERAVTVRSVTFNKRPAKMVGNKIVEQ